MISARPEARDTYEAYGWPGVGDRVARKRDTLTVTVSGNIRIFLFYYKNYHDAYSFGHSGIKLVLVNKS